MFVFGVLFFEKAAAQSGFTNRVVYDFQIGDVIQQEYDEDNYNIDSPTVTIYTVDSFISRTSLQNNSAVRYIFNRQYVRTINPSPVGYLPIVIEHIDTVTYNNLDSFPATSLGANLCRLALSSSMLDEDVSQCNDSVWTVVYGQPFICGMSYTCYTQLLFYKGLGGPYYNSTSAATTVDKHLIITFYKKGNVSCGQRQSLWTYTGVNDVAKTNNTISIFPNPSNGNFTIEKTGNNILQFSLFNLIGQKIISQQLNDNKASLNALNLPKSAYLFSICNASGAIVKSGKLIVE